MIRVLLPLTLLGLAGCAGGFDIRDMRATPQVTPAVITPPTPQPPVLTAKERLVSAIENNGCELSTANSGAVLAEATISREELVNLAQELAGEGRAEVSGSGAVRVITDRCA